MKRVRIYTPFFPFPPDEGAFHVVLDQARTLARAGAAVELVVWKDAPATIARKLAARELPPELERLRITRLGSAGVDSRSADDWLNAGAVGGEDGESRVERFGRVARAALSPLASPELFHYPPARGRLLRTLPPADLGIYHYSFAYPWLRRPHTETRRVVHLHNLESDLAAVRIGGPARPATRMGDAVHAVNHRKLAAHERALGSLVDELWFVSAADLQTLRRHASPARTRLVPPTFSPDLVARRRAAALTSTEPRVCAGVLGRYDFEPNRASLAWIVDSLAPELRRAGFDGRILVAGRGVPPELRDRAAASGFFEFLGFVPDLESFWSRLSFSLTPHVVGSGVRVKMLESLAGGVPALANPAAVEPMAEDLHASPLLFVADDPASWARRIAGEPAPLHTRRTVHAPHEGSSLSGETVYGFLTRHAGPPATG